MSATPKTVDSLPQTGFISRVKKIFEPNDKQIFKISLNTFDVNPQTFGWMKHIEYVNENFDPNRAYETDNITKKIAEAISEYTHSHKIKDPIIRGWTNSNHLGLKGHDAPIEKALTKITVTENNTKKEYVGEDLESIKKIGYNKYTEGFNWDTLMKAIYKKQKDTFVGENEATIVFELDMTKLLTTNAGGRRRSSRKNYKKSAKRTKHHSRPKSRKSSSRK